MCWTTYPTSIIHRILLQSTNSLTGDSKVMGYIIHYLVDCYWTLVVTRRLYPRSQLSKVLMWCYAAM